MMYLRVYGYQKQIVSSDFVAPSERESYQTDHHMHLVKVCESFAFEKVPLEVIAGKTNESIYPTVWSYSPMLNVMIWPSSSTEHSGHL
jgi:hypothetical protein